MELPSGDKVLAPDARGAYRVVLFVAGWFVAGVASTIAAYSFFAAPARAATPHSVEAQLTSIVSDMGEIKKDIAAIECRINMRNVCPPPR